MIWSASQLAFQVRTVLESIHRRTKNRREERLEKVMGGIVDKILASQAEGERKFLELEEKRMCLEVREREREERMKKEEFQLKMMSMIMQAPGHYLYPPFSLPIYPPADYGTSHDDIDWSKFVQEKTYCFT